MHIGGINVQSAEDIGINGKQQSHSALADNRKDSAISNKVLTKHQHNGSVSSMAAAA